MKTLNLDIPQKRTISFPCYNEQKNMEKQIIDLVNEWQQRFILQTKKQLTLF